MGTNFLEICGQPSPKSAEMTLATHQDEGEGRSSAPSTSTRIRGELRPEKCSLMVEVFSTPNWEHFKNFGLKQNGIE